MINFFFFFEKSLYSYVNNFKPEIEYAIYITVDVDEATCGKSTVYEMQTNKSEIILHVIFNARLGIVYIAVTVREPHKRTLMDAVIRRLQIFHISKKKIFHFNQTGQWIPNYTLVDRNSFHCALTFYFMV